MRDSVRILEQPSTHQDPVDRVKESESSDSEWKGLSSSTSAEESRPMAKSTPTCTNGSNVKSLNHNLNGNISFHASVSATALAKCKPVRRKAPFNWIIFNFPHVGGLSTDVNRQVRANQELLVSLFKSCKPLLASRSSPARVDGSLSFDESDLGEEEHKDHDELGSKQKLKDLDDARATGQVIISLFDGEPYSLWNIRDLARYSGFKVVTSWRFPWEAYPGYRHARTLGEIVKKTDGAEVPDNRGPGDMKKKSAWKGEEREARAFVFELIDEGNQKEEQPSIAKLNATQQERQRPRKKRRRGELSSDSDD
jgi:25S rRNA (uracil2634-N3)-methyltransferase